MICRICDEELEFKDVKPMLVCPTCFKRFCDKLDKCSHRTLPYWDQMKKPSPKLLVKLFEPRPDTNNGSPWDMM